MKYLLLLCACFLTVHTATAQEVELNRYDFQSEDLQRVFCDYVKKLCEVKYIASSNGQYIGQTLDGVIYGWGYYLSNEGNQIVGQYRNGKCFFGITMGTNSATVGSDEHFVTYDLTTGKILRLHTDEGDFGCPNDLVDKLLFKKLTYSNGDCYYGETLNGRRHGYGLYYWTNGDFWYGKYVNGYRQGFGALFKVDRRISYGKWIADDKVE